MPENQSHKDPYGSSDNPEFWDQLFKVLKLIALVVSVLGLIYKLTDKMEPNRTNQGPFPDYTAPSPYDRYGNDPSQFEVVFPVDSQVLRDTAFLVKGKFAGAQPKRGDRVAWLLAVRDSAVLDLCQVYHKGDTRWEAYLEIPEKGFVSIHLISLADRQSYTNMVGHLSDGQNFHMSELPHQYMPLLEQTLIRI